MVAAAGLDVTKKHYTNHSILKKSSEESEESGVSAT